jgi:hypothetical protein
LKIRLLSEILRKRTVLKEDEGSWYSDGQIKGDEMDGVCSTYGGEERDVYRVLVGKPGRKRSLGRPRRRREDNIKVDVQGNIKESGVAYSTVTGLGTGFEGREGQGFLFSRKYPACLWALTQLSNIYIQGFLLEVKQPGRAAENSPLSSAEIKNEWIYASAPHTLSCNGQGLYLHFKRMGGRGLNSSSLSQKQVAGCFEDGNELLGCIPWGEEMFNFSRKAVLNGFS